MDSRFWQTVAAIGAILFIVILFYMVKSSSDARDQVVNDTEEQFYSDITSATFVTNEGDFTIQFDHDKAPKTATNFVKLAKEGFYNGQRFHRVIEGFMIQAGDPNSKDLAKRDFWGTGGPGYQFADEFSDLSNVVGTISMANSGPNTNGSQFFINVGDNLFLDGKHSVFGKVVNGLDVVMKISQSKTVEKDIPASDIIIQRIDLK